MECLRRVLPQVCWQGQARFGLYFPIHDKAPVQTLGFVAYHIAQVHLV